MSESHNGTGHYCFECGQMVGERCIRNSGYDIHDFDGYACHEFLPSIAAQQLEQARLSNDLAIIKLYCDGDLNKSDNDDGRFDDRMRAILARIVSYMSDK